MHQNILIQPYKTRKRDIIRVFASEINTFIPKPFVGMILFFSRIIHDDI